MKILKEGDEGLAKGALQFDCKKCGCIFVVDRFEYVAKRLDGIFHSGIIANAMCPCCMKIISIRIND